uniref:Uncharacterized protein n=1 Tax=Anguilla anguilla TaxID=7936 RepID=A0A0E9QDX1_ANGAN
MTLLAWGADDAVSVRTAGGFPMQLKSLG